MNCYDFVAFRKTCEPKCIDDAVLDSVSLLNDISELLEVLRWWDYKN